MNEYERSECYELLGKIIDWDSMLRDNQKDMNQLMSYLRTLEKRQYNKYIRALYEECKDIEDEDEDEY